MANNESNKLPPSQRAATGGTASASETGDVVPLLTFRVGDRWLAVPPTDVAEICDQAPVLPVPGTPSHVTGLINVRGHAVPMLDLRAFLELPLPVAATSAQAPAPAHDDLQRNRVIILAADGMRVGVLADQIRSILQASAKSLRAIEAVSGHRLLSVCTQELCDKSFVAPVLDVTQLLEAARVRR